MRCESSRVRALLACPDGRRGAHMDIVAGFRSRSKSNPRLEFTIGNSVPPPRCPGARAPDFGIDSGSEQRSNLHGHANRKRVDVFAAPQAIQSGRRRSIRSVIRRSSIPCGASRTGRGNQFLWSPDRSKATLQDYGRFYCRITTRRNVWRNSVQKNLGRCFWGCRAR